MGLIWNDSFLVGEPVIDTQHRLLFELSNMTLANDNISQFMTDFLSLFSQICEHFHYEEELMKEIDYPDYAVHVRDHFVLTNRLNQIRVYVDNGILEIDVLQKFIENWAYGHIPGDDVALVKYLNNYRSLQNNI